MYSILIFPSLRFTVDCDKNSFQMNKEKIYYYKQTSNKAKIYYNEWNKY